MPAEPPPELGTTPQDAPVGARADAPSTTVTTEEQLDSPDRLTLRLLGVIFIATFLPWVGAKTACNLRDAPQREPLPLATEVLSKQPKSAALELQQRAATGHYREAAELAKGALQQELLRADERCAAEPKPCEDLRARRDQIFSRAVLVSRTASTAEVRVESVQGEAAEKFALRLEADAGRWYVVERSPYSGELNQPVAVVSGEAPVSPHGASPHGAMPGHSNNVPAAGTVPHP